MKGERYRAIDVFRLIAAILVITVHTSPLTSVSDASDLILTRIVARIAVPFFFVVTGYFVFSPNRSRPFSYGQFLLKTGGLYCLSVLLYLPLNVYARHFTGEDGVVTVAKAVIVDGTFYHLWYFPAVILGVGLIALLLKHLTFRATVAIAGLLYLIGLFGDSYYGIATQIPSVQIFYDTLFLLFSYTRNGLFFTPAFLILGAWIARHPARSSFRVNVVCLCISFAAMLTEGWLLHTYSQPRHDSMYLFLLPSAFFIFQILLSHRSTGQSHLGPVSTFVYILHPWWIIVLGGVAKLVGAQGLLIDNSLLHFSLVTLLSIAVSTPLGLFWHRRRQPPPAGERAWAEINLANLRHNARQLESILPPECRLMAVVKADAYGHGAVRVASELQKTGVKDFAVATLPEGIHLRRNGIRGTILILGYTHPDRIRLLRQYHLTQTVADFSHAEALNRRGKKVRVHIKIDTGMHRLGEEFSHLDEITAMLRFPNLIVDGMYTHLCSADGRQAEDTHFTLQQIARFQSVVDQLRALGCCPPDLHIQSSYGVLNYPAAQNCRLARFGIALYGALSDANDRTEIAAHLKPVLSLRAVVAIVKEIAPGQAVGYGRQFRAASHMKIATVCAGYADGIPRSLAAGRVLIKGHEAPIIGRISMDQCTVDVTDIPGVRPGDIATVIGQDGEKIIPVEHLARQSGTISNEILSRLGARLERVYITGNPE